MYVVRVMSWGFFLFLFVNCCLSILSVLFGETAKCVYKICSAQLERSVTHQIGTKDKQQFTKERLSTNQSVFLVARCFLNYIKLDSCNNLTLVLNSKSFILSICNFVSFMLC